MTTPETFAKNAESIAKLADELAVMFPTLTRVELEKAAVVGVNKAREMRDREAGKKAQSATSKKLCKKGASDGE